MKKNKKITFVIPAYNEEKNLENVVSKINTVAPLYTNTHEIIIVNDGSIDKTGKIAEKIANRDKKVRALHNEVNSGLGHSFLRGAKEAQYEYVMLHFGDDDCPPESLKAVLAQLGKADMVIAYYTNFHITKSWSRHLLSIGYTRLINGITGYSLRYYNGMSIHKTAFIRKMNNISSGLGAQAHMILNSLDQGATYTEVAITNQERAEGVSSALRLSSVVSVVGWIGSAYLKYRVFKKNKN